MTYKELADYILKYPEYHNQDITLMVDDEYYQGTLDFVGDEDKDILELGHLYIKVKLY